MVSEKVDFDIDGRVIYTIGSFTNYADQFLAFFDHQPPFVDIFYVINVDKKW